LIKDKPIVEFHAVNVEARLGNPQRRDRTAVEDTLIGEIVDREHSWNVRVVPFQIAGDQGTLPVIGMDEIGGPILVDQSSRDLRGCIREGREPDIVVAPIGSSTIGIGRAVAFVQRRASDHVIGHAVGSMPEIDREGRKGREWLAPSDGRQVVQPAQDRRVAGDDDADVGKVAQGARESRRDGGESTHLNEV
jgi:hypothetical protein